MRKLPILRGLAAMLLAGGVALAVQTPASGVSAAVPPDISLTNVKAHLQQFQNIANSNGGNRRSTGSGYDASVSYVVQRLTAAGYDVVQQACTSGCSSGAGPNVIADWPGGDPDQVLMLGAHLDGVSAGPGINDNGSGSGTLLEVALTLAAQNPTMDMHVRFAWWTDEEQGLNGSQFYANRLSSTERARIKGYLNFDMVASTNAGYFINRISSSLGQTLKAYYDSIGVPTEENTEGAGRSDDASFNAIGVQTSGVAAGASYRKTTAQAQKWGGTAGQSYDPCYHQSCDTINNISDTVLNRSGDAAAYALWTLAVGTPASNDFSIAASPGSGSVIPGGSVNTTINTTVTSGNAQTVNLTASGVPNGVTAAFNPSTITSGSSSTLTLNVSAGVAIGTYIVTVTGTGADATHTTTYALTVTGAPSGCEGTNGTNVSIPDNTTVESSIPIAGCSGNASATATVEVHIAHTYIGDLVVSLVAPDGTAYPLHNRTGGSADNIDLTYTVDLSSEVADGTWRLRAQDAATYDTGTIDTWTLDLSGGPTPPVCGGTNGDNVTVPDNSTVTSTIAVSGCTGNASSSSKVEVHIVHTYIGDLVVTLVAPDGSAYSLHNRSGGSTNDINETYTVDLSSEARNGTWTLRVQDTASFDSGNIDSWTLTL